MGYTIGMPSLKLSNIDGKGGKHCGNFRKVAKEALKERQGLDMDINPELAGQNFYIGYDTAEKLIEYSENHINELNKWRAENGKRACDKRKLREDTVVMCATVIKPPAEMMSRFTAEQQHQFLQDSFDIFKGFVGEDNIKAAAFHFDERVPHLHIFWEPMTDEHRICAKEMHNLKFFGKLNREMPKRLREKGWSMVKNCQAYDKIEEELKRLEMGEEKYKEYRKAQRANRGKDSRLFKHEDELKISQEKQLLSRAQRVRESEERAASQAHQQRLAEEMKSVALQTDISDKQQTLANLIDNIEQDYSMHKKLKKEAKKYYDIAVSAKEEAEKINAMISEIERIKTEYSPMKEDFLSFVNEEMLKIKSETERDKIKKRVDSEMRSRDEINEELDSFLNEIMQNRTKQKQHSF